MTGEQNAKQHSGIRKAVLTCEENQMENESISAVNREFWTSDQINEIAGALAKAQGEIEGASKASTNPHFRSKYADLASIWEACRDALAKHGLSVVQAPSACGSIIRVTTMLVHSSGQFFASMLELNAIDTKPQSAGSAITYARRYALASMVGVAPEDDDGNAASGRSDGREHSHASAPSAPQVNQHSRSVSAPSSAPRASAASIAGDESVQAMWKEMTTIAGSLAVFERLKKRMCEALGKESGERTYYAKLGAYGVEHANEFRKSEQARACAREIFEAIEATKEPA